VRSPAEPNGTPVTIEEVAQLAGVSPSTVSRILNGTATVSGAKQQAVADAIAQLGFVPNPMARGLATGRTLSIGVVTQAIDSPFYAVALRGIEDELDKAGYSPLFVSGHWDATQEARCIDVLRSRRVDGLIVLTGRLSDASLRNVAKSLPVVVTGRKLKAPGLYALDFDNIQGSRLATEHLLGLGHRRIAFIAGDPLHPDAKARERGYREALEAAGVAFDPSLVVQGAYQEEGGRLAVEQLLTAKRRFSALFSANDQMALGALLSLHRHGLRVPQDVSVVGFDDLQVSMYVSPPLTTVRQPVQDLGRLAAQAVLALLQGRTPTAVLPSPVLVVRDSTSAPPGR
jgi:LacI family transcriptional regulator